MPQQTERGKRKTRGDKTKTTIVLQRREHDPLVRRRCILRRRLAGSRTQLVGRVPVVHADLDTGGFRVPPKQQCKVVNTRPPTGRREKVRNPGD